MQKSDAASDDSHEHVCSFGFPLTRFSCHDRPHAHNESTHQRCPDCCCHRFPQPLLGRRSGGLERSSNSCRCSCRKNRRGPGRSYPSHRREHDHDDQQLPCRSRTSETANRRRPDVTGASLVDSHGDHPRFAPRSLPNCFCASRRLLSFAGGRNHRESFGWLSVIPQHLRDVPLLATAPRAHPESFVPLLGHIYCRHSDARRPFLLGRRKVRIRLLRYSAILGCPVKSATRRHPWSRTTQHQIACTSSTLP